MQPINYQNMTLSDLEALKLSWMDEKKDVAIKTAYAIMDMGIIYRVSGRDYFMWKSGRMYIEAHLTNRINGPVENLPMDQIAVTVFIDNFFKTLSNDDFKNAIEGNAGAKKPFLVAHFVVSVNQEYRSRDKFERWVPGMWELDLHKLLQAHSRKLIEDANTKEEKDREKLITELQLDKLGTF